MNTLTRKQIFSNFISAMLYIATLIYLLIFFKIILFKSGIYVENKSFNFIPFTFVQEFFYSKTSIDILLKNIFGNIFLFFPMGIILPLKFKILNFKNTAFVCFMLSLILEIIQYSFKVGISDIDDLILNTFGGVLGFIYFKILNINFKNKLTLKAFTLLSLSIFGLTGYMSLILLHPTMLPPKVTIVNKSILKSVNLDNYSLDTTGIKIEEYKLFTNVDKQHLNSTTIFTPSSNGCYSIDDNTQIFSELIKSTYSPNGNIQTTKVIYNKISITKANYLLKNNHFIKLWVHKDKCDTVLISTYQ